ncbi:WD repeat-containing protein on Y chromosome [Drosophila kikkawai]|uniref:WD repeat-containing protein on Y chromosome n=1 Tax=Drosophila kikkawai TaxID=30033 RepID=A0A6P4JEJ3_DROKI|nr:WD repeat-containing protein on Y chromosome [Drosophila kikkawai]
MDKWEKEHTNDLSQVLANSLKEPILGKHFSLPGRTCQKQTIELDTSQSYIAVYTHLKVHAAVMPDRLPTPESLGRAPTTVEGKPKVRASKNNCQVHRS